MDAELMAFLWRWLHVISGVMWIGILWYFNFVQIPNMGKIPDEQKPAIGKVIAPAALFWFRWAAMATIVTGLILATYNGYIADALALQAVGADILLLECVPTALAAEITSTLTIPVIGIGAGASGDWHDIGEVGFTARDFHKRQQPGAVLHLVDFVDSKNHGDTRRDRQFQGIFIRPCPAVCSNQ